MVMNHFLIIHPQDHPKVASWTHFSRVGFEDVQGQLYTKHRLFDFCWPVKSPRSLKTARQ
jgi:hypothetical protein